MLQFFSTADNITAIAAASYVLFQAARGIYRRTLGSRRVTVKAIRSLTPGNPIAMVEELFGLHVYSASYTLGPHEFDEDQRTYSVDQRLYNARHGWLTVHYIEDKVSAFAFMQTDRKLRFALDPTCRGMVKGTLGRTTFAEISDERPGNFSLFIGAYNWGYSETHYYGRSGNYQHYAFSNTMFGWSARRKDVPGLGSIEAGSFFEMNDLSSEELSRIDYYRKVNAPDTVAVFGTNHGLGDPSPGSGSYDQDDMRNLEGDGPRGWTSRSAFDRASERFPRLRKIRYWWHEKKARRGSSLSYG